MPFTTDLRFGFQKDSLLIIYITFSSLNTCHNGLNIDVMMSVIYSLMMAEIHHKGIKEEFVW